MLIHINLQIQFISEMTFGNSTVHWGTCSRSNVDSLFLIMIAMWQAHKKKHCTAPAGLDTVQEFFFASWTRNHICAYWKWAFFQYIIKCFKNQSFQKMYRIVASTNTCYYSENQVFGGVTIRVLCSKRGCY